VKQGGKMVLLPHDMWGADGTRASSISYPGDDGNWTSYDNFLTQFIADIKHNGMEDNIVVDIWNEPNGSNFWHRDQSQYLEMFGRAYYRLK
jgi:hypothetical protein